MSKCKCSEVKASAKSLVKEVENGAHDAIKSLLCKHACQLERHEDALKDHKESIDFIERAICSTTRQDVEFDQRIIALENKPLVKVPVINWSITCGENVPLFTRPKPSIWTRIKRWWK